MAPTTLECLVELVNRLVAIDAPLDEIRAWCDANDMGAVIEADEASPDQAGLVRWSLPAPLNPAELHVFGKAALLPTGPHLSAERRYLYPSEDDAKIVCSMFAEGSRGPIQRLVLRRDVFDDEDFERP